MAKTAAIAPKRELVKIHVRFVLNTPDGLRRVSFELEKDTGDDSVVSWKITFQLFERAKKSDPFGDALVDLLVEVDSKLNSKAQAVADDGMTPGQAAFALGPASDTAKDPAASDEKKSTTVQNTLKK
jgi:hypothetical protein